MSFCKEVGVWEGAPEINITQLTIQINTLQNTSYACSELLLDEAMTPVFYYTFYHLRLRQRRRFIRDFFPINRAVIFINFV